MSDQMICAQCNEPCVQDPFMHQVATNHLPLREVVTAADVDDAVLDLAEMITDGWYSDGPIDWEDVFDRMEGMEPWSDGPLTRWQLSLGSEYDSKAMRKIQREIRKRRNA